MINILKLDTYLKANHAISLSLSKNRELLWEMGKLDLRERYVGQVLGLSWAIMTPLLTMAIYIFVFAIVFKAKIPQVAGGISTGWGSSYPIYLLSGLIPWMGIQEVIGRSPIIISSNANLVKQVLFPLEILPIKSFYTLVINQGIAYACLFFFAFLSYGGHSFLILCFPVAFALQLILSAGIALLLSAVGVYLRDLKDIMSVFCFVLVYAMPIFYTSAMLPDYLIKFMLLNPFYHVIAVFHDILFYGKISSPVSWIIFPAFSFATWLVGCKIFYTLKNYFGNVL